MGIRLVLNTSLTMEDTFCVGCLSQVELAQVAKRAAAQYPHAWPKPYPWEDAGLRACTSWSRQSLSNVQKTADSKLVYFELYFLSSSCFVFKIFLNYHRLAY